MKKFSKILTLILALVVIVTAFTVVALAETEPTTANPAAAQIDFEHANWTVGKVWGTVAGSAGTGDLKVAEAYSGGNKYLEIVGSTNSTATARYNNFFTNVETGKTDYSIRNNNFASYPIAVLDFDLMTPNGNWGLYSASNSGNSAGLYIRPYIGSSMQKATGMAVSFGNLGLPTTPYVWHHVTVIYEHSSETVDDVTTEYITQSVYADGKLTTSTYINGKYAVTNASSMWFGALYLKTSRYNVGEIVAVDNVAWTYAQAGYDTSKLITAVYNEDWEAPFGKLLATVTVGEEVSYFDDLGEANTFAQANPGSKISLADNMTTPYYVDSELTIDANIYDENGVSTGVYTGVLENARTTKGYYLEETAEGSGIYVAKMGDFISNGKAYTAEQFVSVVNDAEKTPAASKVKLLADIEISATIATKAAEIDLNGFTLKKVSYYGNVFEATGTEEYPTEANGTAVAASSTLFSVTVTNFKVTSSNGQGKIYTVTANADTYYRDGVMEKRVINSYANTTLFYHELSNATFTFENVDIYGGVFANVGHGARSNNSYVMNNVRYYQMSSVTGNNTFFLFYLHGGPKTTVTATDCLFYFNDHTNNMTSGLIRFVNAPNDAANPSIAKFTNCDIIANDDGADRVEVMNAGSADQIQLVDCRVYNMGISNKVAASNGTISNAIDDGNSVAVVAPLAAADWTNMALAQSIGKTYVVPSVHAWSATADTIQAASTDIETKNYVCTYTQITTKAVDVDLVDGDSTKTIQLFPGVDSIDDIRVVHELSDNDYLNVLCQWSDAAEGGNAVSGVLGLGDNEVVFDWETTKVTLYAQDTIGDVTKYVGGIKDINFNLGFLSGFRYNLYTPVENEILTDINVDGYTKGDTVTITGEDEIARQYTVWSKLVGTAAAADANVISATFKVDGVDYSQSWSINAVQYAEVLIEYPAYETEKPAIGNMVKLIKEAKLALDSEADVTALDTVIASAGVSAGYADYTDGNADALADFSGIIADVNFVIYNGVASYKFILVEEGAELTFTNANGEAIGTTVDGTAVILDVMRVYDLIAPITVTSGDISATFTMVDYLTKLNNAEGINLAKALYEFGVAADAYKAEIMANN